MNAEPEYSFKRPVREEPLAPPDSDPGNWNGPIPARPKLDVPEDQVRRRMDWIDWSAIGLRLLLYSTYFLVIKLTPDGADPPVWLGTIVICVLGMTVVIGLWLKQARRISDDEKKALAELREEQYAEHARALSSHQQRPLHQ